MKTDNPRIALISLENDDSRIYQGLMSSHNYFALEAHPSIQQFKNSCLGKLYSGFIVDMRVIIRSSIQEKEFFTALDEGFPVIQVRRNPDNSTINCLVTGKQSGDLRGEQLLNYFVCNDCRKMAPRQVRIHPRKNIFLNTHLYFTETGDPIKTNLWNISEGGCFVLSTHRKKKGNHVWLVINELKDKSPIRCEIRWAKPWGTAPTHMPGFGVSFLEITEGQHTQIREILSFHS